MTKEDNNDEKRLFKRFFKTTKSKIQHWLFKDDHRDLNDQLNDDSEFWLYNKFFNVNDKNNKINQALQQLDNNKLRNCFDKDKDDQDDNYESINSLDDLLVKLKKRNDIVCRLSKLILLINIAMIVIPIIHPNVFVALIGILLWLGCCFGNCYNTSINMMAQNIASRTRDDYDKIKNERIAYLNLIAKNNSVWLINMIMIACNFELLPFFEEAYHVKTINIFGTIVNNSIIHASLGQPFLVRAIFISTGIFLGCYIFKRFRAEMVDNATIINKRLSDLRYNIPPLHELLNGGKSADYVADIKLGRSLISGDIVDFKVKDRANGAIIVGPNGSGKTASIYKPIIAQDLVKFLTWLRAYPELRQRSDYFSNNVAAKYLNGIVVVDTTNDLCKTTYQLAHNVLGIPTKMIRYLDPMNPNSDSINLMRGNAEKVAETLSDAINEMAHGNNEYFAQAQREWLKSFIFLVKYANVLQVQPPTMDDLFDVSLNIAKTAPYKKLLEVYDEIADKAQVLYYIYTRKFNSLKVKRNPEIEKAAAQYAKIGSPAFKKALKDAANPDDVTFFNMANESKHHDINRFISHDKFCADMISLKPLVITPKVNEGLNVPFSEVRTAYKNVHETLIWLDTNIVEISESQLGKIQNMGKGTDIKIQKDDQGNGWLDMMETSVKGIKNIMDDLQRSDAVRRIFFNIKDNDNFSMDGFFKSGGILLCSTAGGEISDTLSSTIGRIYESIITTAAMRREVDNGGAAEPLVSSFWDEAIAYIPQNFSKIPGQIRKYNFSIMIAVQSLAQIDEKFNVDTRNNLLGTMRTKITFGDLQATDAQIFSKEFGTHYALEQRTNQNRIDIAADQDYNRKSMSTAYREVPNISPAQLMNMQPYTIAVRRDLNNQPFNFEHIKVDLVNNQELHEKHHFGKEEQDISASEAFDEAMNKQNPDFVNFDYVLHNYFLLAYRARSKDNTEDISEQIDQNLLTSINQRNYKTVQNNRNIDADLAMPDLDNVEETYHVNGVPDWVLEVMDNAHIFDNNKQKNHKVNNNDIDDDNESLSTLPNDSNDDAENAFNY